MLGSNSMFFMHLTTKQIDQFEQRHTFFKFVCLLNDPLLHIHEIQLRSCRDGQLS